MTAEQPLISGLLYLLVMNYIRKEGLARLWGGAQLCAETVNNYVWLILHSPVLGWCPVL